MLPYLVIGILLLGMLAVVAVVLIIATWRLQLPVLEEIAMAEYPPDQLDRQKHLGAKMESAGFEFVGMQRERRGPKYQVWQALFRTSNGAVWGVVEAVADDSPRIVFHSFFANERTVTTADGEFADYNVTENWRLTEQKCASLIDQAKLHQQRSLGAGAKPLALQTADEFRACYLATTQREFAHLKEVGFLQEVAEGDEFKVIPWKSAVIALRMFFHSRRYQWAEQGRRKTEAYNEELKAEKETRQKFGEVGELKYLEYYKRDRQKGTALSLLGWTPPGAAVFALIILLLLISMGRGTLEVSSAYIIICVLVLHELGHAITMRVFGYRDFSVFFLPLIGRLGGSRKVRVPAWQEFVALLMGPIPGLLFGWALLLLAFFVPSLPEFWQKVGFWAALINNVNLFAVLPYDGGRIVNLLLFERVPAVRVAYLVISGLAMLGLILFSVLAIGPLALAALWPFLLIGIAAFIALPNTIRLAKMAPWAKKNLSPEDDETEALIKAFQIVEQTGSVRGLEKRGWTEFVDRVIKFGCSRKLGGVGTVAAMVVFLFFLCMPFWILVCAAVGESGTVKKEQVELEKRISELSSEVSWGGAVVTKKTRADLETLQDSYLSSLQALYSDDLALTSDAVNFDERGIFDTSEAIEMVRALRWDEVATWVTEENTNERQEVVRILVESLLGEAREKALMGNSNAAMTGLSRAYWAISTCEPKTSLSAWIDWLYLEHSLLLEIQELMSSRGVSSQYGKWFAATLRTRPRFEGSKMALLLFYDLQGASLDDLPAVTGAREEGAQIDEAFAGLGYPLRRSEADRDFRREGGKVERVVSLSGLMSATRVLQGLPTREEYRAGFRVADAWAESEDFDLSLLQELDSEAQKEIWKARIEWIQRLQHYRLLAVSALEVEMFAADPSGTIPGVKQHGLPIETELLQMPSQRFAVGSYAPDGTRFMWELSPHFAKRRQAHLEAAAERVQAARDAAAARALVRNLARTEAAREAEVAAAAARAAASRNPTPEPTAVGTPTPSITPIPSAIPIQPANPVPGPRPGPAMTPLIIPTPGPSPNPGVTPSPTAPGPTPTPAEPRPVRFVPAGQ